MAASMMSNKALGMRASAAGKTARRAAVVSSRKSIVKPMAAASSDLGFEKMRDGIKVAADETLLTPRFYTT